MFENHVNIVLPEATDIAWQFSTTKSSPRRIVFTIPKRDKNNNIMHEDYKGQQRPLAQGYFILQDDPNNRWSLIATYLPSTGRGRQCIDYQTCDCEYCVNIHSTQAEVQSFKGIFDWNKYVQAGYWSSLERVDNFMNTLQAMLDEVQEKVNEV